MKTHHVYTESYIGLCHGTHSEAAESIVTTNAVFAVESADAAEEEKISRQNTVAIMFPYLRSQVTLMTSQPNLKPIILPMINVSNMQ